MRPLLHTDVRAAARAVHAVPPEAQAAFCARLLREADWADRYTRRLGRPHPFWGNGTLMGAAFGHRLAPETTFDDVTFCTSFEVVVRQLADRKRVCIL